MPRGFTLSPSRIVGIVRTFQGGGRGWILLAIAGGWLLSLGLRVVVPALLPAITAEFSLSNTTAGFALTLVLGAYAVTQFPGGLLVDRRGERGVLLMSTAVSAVAILLFALAPGFPVFIAACVLLGLGTGLFGPPLITLLAKTFPEQRNAAIGTTFAAGNVGAASLPVIASLIAARFGWRAGFGFAVPLFVLVFVGQWRSLPRPSPSSAAIPVRVLLRRLTVALRGRAVVLASVALTFMMFTYQGLTSFLPTYLVATKGLSPSTAAALFGLFFLSSAITQPIAGSAADRFGDRPVLVALAGLHAVTLVVLVSTQGILSLVAVVVVLGTRAGIGPVNSAYLLAALPEEVEGSGYGLVRSVYTGIGATGSIFVGAFADADLFDVAFLVLAAMLVIILVFFVLMPPRD